MKIDSTRRSSLTAFVVTAVLAAALAATALPAAAQSAAPERPTGLDTTSIARDSVTLAWDNPGDTTITHYRVLRRDRDVADPGVFDTINDNTGTAATTYTDNTAQPAKRYTYRVVAVNAHGASPRSSYVNADTPAEPDRPTGLHTTTVAHDQVTLAWDDPGDSTITGYKILRRDIVNQPAGTFTTIEDDTETAATTYTDTTVATQTRYAYRVVAVNTHGPSPRSSYVNADIPELLTAEHQQSNFGEPPVDEQQPGEHDDSLIIGLDGDDDPVTISDNGLRAAVNLALEREATSTTPITEADLAGLTELDASSRGIRSLSGLEHATGLTSLNLRFNKLTSVDVSANTALTRLNLWGNRLTTVDLSANTALTYLNLSDNRIVSVDLSANTALTHLYINHAWYGRANRLTSIDLSANTALTHLHLRLNDLRNIDLSANTALTHLDLSGNREFLVAESSGINDLTALTYLNLNRTGDSSRHGDNAANYRGGLNVTRLVNLKTLALAYSANSSPTGHQNLTSLQYLNVAGTVHGEHTWPSHLSSLTALKHLVGYHHNENLIDLTDLTNLEHVDLSIGKLTSINVDGLTKLRYLNLGNNGTYGGDGFSACLERSDISNFNDLPTGAKVRVAKTNDCANSTVVTR